MLLCQFTTLLHPGWTDEDAPDEEQLRLLGAEISSAIFLVNGVRYTNQKSIGLYPTTGSADDWFYSDDANENNGDYRAAAYTIELRDTGNYGFVLPPAQVRWTGSCVQLLGYPPPPPPPSCMRLWTGLLSLHKLNSSQFCF